MSQARNEDYWTSLHEYEADLEDWQVRRRRRMAIQCYGALCAYSASHAIPENLLSLATCKCSPTPVRSPDSDALSTKPELGPAEAEAVGVLFRLGVDDVDRAARLVAGGGDRLAAIYGVLDRDDPERTKKVLALLDRDEVGHALRLATCGRRSVQLGCPEEAGGCGCEENYIPIHCGSRLCPDCQKRRIGQEIQKWIDEVAGMEHPVFGTFTIQNVQCVEEAVSGTEQIVEDFGRLRRRTIPYEGETCRDGVVKRWQWGVGGEQPADSWRASLQGRGARDLAAYLERKYVEYEYEDVTGQHVGRNIPFEEVVEGGIYGIDVKQTVGGEFNVHLHTLMDAAYVPQSALSAVWEDLTGDPVVDIRPVYGRGGMDLETALSETIGYAVKPPEFETVEEEVEYAVKMKGKALVHPFGDLHGNAGDVSGLLRCAGCDQTPAWWEYLGLVEEEVDTMGKGWDTKGENDPPDQAGVDNEGDTQR